ncbi:hypothetical protein V6N13_106871 [Hibiscus sabdariffa]
MSSSDEEGEFCPEVHVSEYAFVDHDGQPISFAVLPLQWSENEVIDQNKTQVFLDGFADNGLEKIYKQIVAWKFELSYAMPEILVLTKNKKWMTLQKPRRSFGSMIRTILITIHWLHFMKKNSEELAKSVWSHLQNVFSLYEFEPSEGDLLCHKLLIGEAVKRDKDLANSKNVINFLQMPQRNITSHQDVIILKKDKFIDNGDGGLDEEYNDDDIGEEVGGAGKSIFDPVCAICDDGGNVLACEGRCLRSFHPTKAAGIDTFCESLGFVNDAQIDAIPSFLCNNCLYKQHQCFACGELGSCNNSSGQEVFPCVSATCGHFYHPKCVAKLLHPDNEAEAKNLRDKIAAGDSFTCPTHKCFVCKRTEDAEVYDLQFALCRRCPKAYHRKCLPKNICFEYNKYKNSLQRAWENLLPYNRILIYCMEHKIIRELGTPSRDHLIFPDLKFKEKIRKMGPSYCGNNLASARSDVSEGFATSRNLLKKPKPVQKDYDVHAGACSERTEKVCSGQEFSPLRKQNTCITDRNFLKQDASADFYTSLARGKNKLSQTKGNLKVKLQLDETGFKIRNTNQNMHMMGKAERTKPLIDDGIEKGILALIKDVDSSFDAEEYLKSQKQIFVANACSFRSKSITLGRVEASVKAVRTALEKLEKGASLEDAKTVCQPDVIKEIIKWKENLAVYLGPFLHGMRYTSFGRHFTKVEKLKEIVDRLHWYVQDGDTIVDFCCGSNDFSCLLKEKLEKVGKSCSFKNYDLFQPKNDFNFEKRDWMSVKLDELPDGSRLIMGLNPPFGVKASRANKFINKALTFRPKLIILIVPRETRRLDEKEAYDLIWEDDRVLSGKARIDFSYRSVDVEDKQLEQWNVKAPPLYLWSRRDWTGMHKAIAQHHGHAYYGPEELDGNEHNAKEVGFNYLMQEKHDCYADFSLDVHACGGISSILDGVPEVNDGFESEGSRGKHMEGMFPGSSSSIWKYKDLSKQIHDNVIEMQHEEHGHMDALPEAAVDYGTALGGDDDLCVDMELSSPDNRPGPPENYEAPRTEARYGVSENRGKGSVNLGFKTEYRFREMQNRFPAHQE